MASGSPIIPIFTLATGRGRCKVFVERPIEVDPNADLVDGALPAVRQIAAAIEKYVVANPDQWLVLDRAFVEDTL
jgi:lauroyl/myristoyl acyltransferase